MTHAMKHSIDKVFGVTMAMLLCLSCKENTRSEESLIDRCSVIATREVTEAGDTVVVCDMAKYSGGV